jgi:hypothetical protein
MMNPPPPIAPCYGPDRPVHFGQEFSEALPMAPPLEENDGAALPAAVYAF